MKKILYIAAAATLALASCSSESDMAEQNPENENGLVPVEFANPYLGTTRATVINLAGLKDKGFGVYAYEQGSTAWDTYRSSNVYPNFFYNQKVSVEAGNTDWTYKPVKYFSNNIGAKHSFFAYAPYNESNNAIFSMANNAPVIRYTAKEDYDLLWAPAIIDKEKPGVETKLAFHFQHALSKVTFKVAPFINQVHTSGDHDDYGTVTANTTITVRSVKFTGKVPSQGLLNLRNGEWTIEATEEGAYEITNPVKFSAGAISPQTLISNMMVIPATGVKVKVVYDVTTLDDENPKNNSTVTNTVESEGTFNLDKGTAYTFNLDLGLTSVKFTADVTEWPTTDEGKDVDLPNNVATTVNDVSSTAVTATVGAKSDIASPTDDQYVIDTDNKLYQYKSSAWSPAATTIIAKVGTTPDYYVYSGSSTTWVKVTATATDANDAKSKGVGYYLISNALYEVK